jgi:hypothetical protein
MWPQFRVLAVPARGISFTGGAVDLLAVLQDGDVVAVVALGGGDEADPAVLMVLVIPADETVNPGLSRLEAHEGAIRGNPGGT